MRPLRVLYVAPYFHPAIRYGGTTEVMLRFSRAVREAGVDLRVVATNADGRRNHDLPTGHLIEVEGVPIVFCERWPLSGYWPSVDLARYVDRELGGYDLVHVWMNFSFPTAFTARAARRAGIPYVMSPSGAVAPSSMARRWWKKWPYWYLTERASVRGAAFLHASSDQESADIAAVVPGRPVVTIINGIDLPDGAAAATPRAPRRLVFLGRLHEIKGFDVLIPALGLVAARMPDVETVLAGYDDEGQWAKIERMLDTLTPRPRVRFIGPVSGADKVRFLAGARALVLTSHRESFAQVVLEALACGTPAVVSRNAPWAALEAWGAGIWVPNTTEAVAAALLRILESPPQAYQAMSSAARALAATHRWSAAAEALIGHYQSAVAAPEAAS